MLVLCIKCISTVLYVSVCLQCSCEQPEPVSISSVCTVCTVIEQSVFGSSETILFIKQSLSNATAISNTNWSMGNTWAGNVHFSIF